MTLQVVFCAAEAAPFAKVGGLADVVGSLPRALHEAGVAVCVLLPRYGCIDPDAEGFEQLDVRCQVPFEDREETIALWHGHLPESSVPVYLVENATWFASRRSVYPEGDPQTELNSFLFFSAAVFEALHALTIRPDVLHLHDWHTAPVAVKLAHLRQEDSAAFGGNYADTRSVLTIHNLSYQGHDGTTNWLAEGIRHADEITTVSPSYALEIQTPQQGCGLDILLREHQSQVQGILNGIDEQIFDPATDRFLPKPYDIESFEEGKAFCKADLQRELGLPAAPEKPLFGMVSRLVEQKGLDILLPALEVLASDLEAQWVILGSGEPRYEDGLRALSDRFRQVAVHLGFNLALAQKIYAGSDFFLMPSRFEPCGLGQIIAMRYGSLPVVRAVGGLADTVKDVDDHPRDGTGIVFREFDIPAMAGAVRRAEALYCKPENQRRVIRNAMSANFSWSVSAKAYREVYNSLVSSSPADPAKTV